LDAASTRLRISPVGCAPAGHVEASEKRDHSDQRLYRNYGGQIYDSPAWTDDV
jgi:hypothetical protein